MNSLASPAPEIPSIHLHLPTPQTLFRARADRLRQLATNHPSLAGYLTLMAELSDLQHGQVEESSLTPPPDVSARTCPLDIANRSHGPAWRAVLRAIAGGLAPNDEPLAAIRDRLRAASDEVLEGWAERLLSADFENLDSGLAPFVAAALQVRWTVLAGRIDGRGIGPGEFAHLCPVCSSLPVASVLRSGGDVQGLRYLCCGLCGTQWNRPRIQCVNCGSGKDVAYYGIEGSDEAVKAEACTECKTYLKMMNREKQPPIDPLADDLATLSLDILMAEEGYERIGFNCFLIPDA
ncbi:formate dehydrogenase accessory protein FdhE [Methylohalobius crimeensis]|uniref:formate dehydrogenase accessory protein FdhE n=1 Tax=Methylohalobius crimeensis TaxID=244365 RepID=UPI0003B79EDD|nr:formate dehydrogenase accessory protein FdhE [Methylohalobius crimeensis]